MKIKEAEALFGVGPLLRVASMFGWEFYIPLSGTPYEAQHCYVAIDDEESLIRYGVFDLQQEEFVGRYTLSLEEVAKGKRDLRNFKEDFLRYHGDKLLIWNFLIPPLEILADHAYQDVAWVRKRMPDGVCYSELMEMLFHSFHIYLETESRRHLTEEERELLADLLSDIKAFERNLKDEAYQNMSLVVDDPKWDAIREKGKEALTKVHHELRFWSDG